MHLRIGTRGSKLALWQADFVAEKLLEAKITSEIVIIETKGDVILDKSLSKIGSKGIFTEELEQQLRTNDIDIAVHSAKDLSSEIVEDLAIIAFMEREMANDVLISLNPAIILDENSKITIGTSSTRRLATLRHFYPQIKTVEMRGNLQTRMDKLKNNTGEDRCDAMILAYAGVNRMNYNDFIVQTLDLEQFTPAVGQGSVAIQVAKNLPKEIQNMLIQTLNHQPTSVCIDAERAFLRTLQGGCSVPVFGYCKILDNKLHFTGGIISLDGQKIIKKIQTNTLNNAQKLGTDVANALLAEGAGEILSEIKSRP